MSNQHEIRLNELNWVDLRISPNQMYPENTLNMGQCFNWQRLAIPITQDSHSPKYWIGVVDGIPLLLRQLAHTSEAVCLTTYTNPVVTAEDSKSTVRNDDQLRSMLRSYFQVEEDLTSMYEIWSRRCDRMHAVTKCLQGVRVARQDPWECLISFICSSNNNISRITQMLERLRRDFGRYLCTVRVVPYVEHIDNNMENTLIHISSQLIDNRTESNTKSFAEYDLFSFPSVTTLASLEEDVLRAMGFGYRAKFVVESAKLVQAKSLAMSNNADDEYWLHSLRQCNTKEVSSMSIKYEKSSTPGDPVARDRRIYVQEELLLLPGVGRKVADCVALFSLDQSEAIPVDTHVWNIALRDYAPQLQQAKSLTPAIYEQVGDVFRELFQHRAGWAHSVLFAAELPTFRQLLPEALQEEMKQFIVDQKKGKLQKKEAAIESKIIASPVKISNKVKQKKEATMESFDSSKAKRARY
jgi:N-glycosylase/DNA lyase